MQPAEKTTSKTPATKHEAPVQVLHIIKSLGRGGAETLLPETLAKHDQERFQFHYIYFLPWKDQMVKQIKEGGGRVSCFEAHNNFQIFRKVGQIAAYVKEHNIQLIHCHLPWAGIVGRLVGKKTGVPVIYTEHNKWERYHKFTYLLNKLSFSAQDRVIAVSEDVAQSIKNHYKKPNPKIQVVLNGINTEKFSKTWSSQKDIRNELRIPESAIVIGLVCVFRVQKRLHHWLEVAKRLHDQNSTLHFIVAGDGPLKEEVHAKAAQIQMQHYVHFVGLQTEIRPYLKAMDIFMMSSEFEGLPIALLEAMSMECMPACTAAGGIPELVKNNENGVLVPVEKPMELVNALTPLLNNPRKIKELGKAARNTVETSFSMQQMVTHIETIYTQLLNKQH